MLSHSQRNINQVIFSLCVFSISVCLIALSLRKLQTKSLYINKKIVFCLPSIVSTWIFRTWNR